MTRPFWQTMTEAELVAHSIRVSCNARRRLMLALLEQWRRPALWFWEC